MDPGNPLIPRLVEPAYQTSPRYWRIVLGSSQRESHWLVVDGDRLYFDRGGTGDLSDPTNLVSLADYPSSDMRRFRVGDVYEKGQSTAHRNLVFFADELGGIILRVFLNWGPIQGAYAVGSLSQEFAPEIVLNGPLRLAPIENSDDFVSRTRTEESLIEVRVKAAVGTPLSCGTRISYISHDPFPEELQPVAEFQFLDDAMAPVGTPLVVRLSGRSCGCIFFATIETRWIKTNLASVRLSFDCPTPVPVSPFEFLARINLDTVVEDSCDI